MGRKPSPNKDRPMRLRELRIAKRRTQKNIADALHLSQASVSMHERGVKIPSQQTLEKYSKHYGVSVDELFVN